MTKKTLLSLRFKVLRFTQNEQIQKKESRKVSGILLECRGRHTGLPQNKIS